jgi:hypothetical protein
MKKKAKLTKILTTSFIHSFIRTMFAVAARLAALADVVTALRRVTDVHRYPVDGSGATSAKFI